jgi:2-methylaconitate cis-trans-isomerase PrpF
VDFTFVQMGIRDGVLDYRGSCGNMTAGVAAFAVDEGLVEVPPAGKDGEEGGGGGGADL